MKNPLPVPIQPKDSPSPPCYTSCFRINRHHGADEGEMHSAPMHLNPAPADSSPSSISSNSPQSSALALTSTFSSSPPHPKLSTGKRRSSHLTYSLLIAEALLAQPTRMARLSTIYRWIMDHHAEFRTPAAGWQNSIRHNLSINRHFVRVTLPQRGKGNFWSIHPDAVETYTQALQTGQRPRRTRYPSPSSPQQPLYLAHRHERLPPQHPPPAALQAPVFPWPPSQGRNALRIENLLN
ncbi:uncharacterized protein VTP21DRAFT_8107 [Calcarisporiella thermophila]|uniref:uncharacterized protein n=1 Tax=Calcarisporiella thermophila TaxID=911321 RepID=UPI0037439C63